MATVPLTMEDVEIITMLIGKRFGRAAFCRYSRGFDLTEWQSMYRDSDRRDADRMREYVQAFACLPSANSTYYPRCIHGLPFNKPCERCDAITARLKGVH